MSPFESIHIFIMVMSLMAGYYLGYKTQEIKIGDNKA